MPNSYKERFLGELRERFGAVQKLRAGNSLYQIRNDAARVYIRYSKKHDRNQSFFGLRVSDLRELEGHNSYICLLTDSDIEPVCIPYGDFEEVFHDARPAGDGQYKVQLLAQQGTVVLYIARQGRFSMEGYVGISGIGRSLVHVPSCTPSSLSHCQVQTLVGGIGHAKGFDVYIPLNNVVQLDWSLTPEFAVRTNLPTRFREIMPILGEIDVVWMNRRNEKIEGLFEIEHSTTIYSGLLRFNDVLLTDPAISQFSIVADEGRRSVFARQVSRPTFRRSGLAEVTTFLRYENVAEWHLRLSSSVKAVGHSSVVF